MTLIIISFVAGLLSVLAPCVLPVIPVIFGGSLSGNTGSKAWRIILSMMISILLFTLLLKVSSLFLNIDPAVWTWISGVIIGLYGLVLIWPQLRERFSMTLKLDRINAVADSASAKGGLRGDILLGASLGPIFSTCSPTYVLLFSTVLPINFGLALICMIVYVLGFGGFLALLVKGGRSLVQKFYGISDNHSRFKRFLGILLVVTGTLIVTGYIKKLEVAFVDYTPSVAKLEQYILNETKVFEDIDKDSENDNQNDQIDIIQGSLLNANYLAPDIEGLTGRLNTSGYTSLSQLKGKVIIIDFRTYSCINCIRTLPYIQARHQKYAKDGLVIIGAHAPEFAFEKKLKNVQKAAEEFGLTYPIAQDNDYVTWRNFKNHYRPAKYIIDREGRVRYTHFGEGAYEETEKVIQLLLGLSGTLESNEIQQLQDEMDNLNGFGGRTPETYLGTQRRDRMSDKPTEDANYRWLGGQRKSEDEHIVLQSATGSISINALGREVNLVLGTEDDMPTVATVLIDGVVSKTIEIQDHKLYNLYKSDIPGIHKVEILFDKAGVQGFAYTFG